MDMMCHMLIMHARLSYDLDEVSYERRGAGREEAKLDIDLP